MGLLDYLRSFWGPTTKPRFAKLFLAEARRVRPQSTFVYNEHSFSIHYDADGIVNLTNFYQEYLQLPKERQGPALTQFAQALLISDNFQLPADFEDVHPDLLPVVRSRMYFESVRLQTATAHKTLRSADNFPHQVLAGNLAVSLVYDLPQVMQTILNEQLEMWGVSLYEALEAATENLKQMGGIQVMQLGKGSYVSCCGDNYDASRLLLNGFLDQLQVEGDLIAMVPNRDLLIITGSEDLDGQEKMLALAFQSLQQPRPISTITFRREEDGFAVWLPERTSPHFEQFQQLQHHTVSQEYADQKEMLEQFHEACGEGPFVATFQLVEDEARVRTSYCVWGEGVSTLLPEADTLCLMRVPGEGTKPEETLFLPWDSVVQQCGHLFMPTEHYPTRWKVDSFPDAEDWERLKPLAIRM